MFIVESMVDALFFVKEKMKLTKFYMKPAWILKLRLYTVTFLNLREKLHSRNLSREN